MCLLTMGRMEISLYKNKYDEEDPRFRLTGVPVDALVPASQPVYPDMQAAMAALSMETNTVVASAFLEVVACT